MSAMPRRVMLYVQHLLGIGHLVRSCRIARGLAEHGFETLVVSGGVPVPGLDVGAARLLQLAPVKAGDDGFSSLAHADGRAFSDGDKAERAAALLDAFEAFSPHALIIEAFPFGRRQMRFELLPLLERANAHGTLIASSIRDILQEQKKPERIEETVALVERYVDLVLVHGAADGIPIEKTFPAASRFAGKIAYTGLVGDLARSDPAAETHDVIVSVGGGAVGAALVEAALGARRILGERHHSAADWRWLVLTGPNMPEHRAFALQAEDEGLNIERFVPDLPQRLKMARLSVSQAGYNTVADVLAAGCACILVPFAAGGETEQTHRAAALAAQDRCVMLEEADLSAETLADGIEKALGLPRPSKHAALDGARETARIIEKRLNEATRSTAVRSA